MPRFAARPARWYADFVAIVTATIAVTVGLLLPIVSLIWLTVIAALPAQAVDGSHKLLRASGFWPSLHGAWDLARGDAVRTVLLAAVVATTATRSQRRSRG